MMNLCQRILGVRGMTDKWKAGGIMLIFKRDMMSCGSYGEVKLI